jgi:uncharacterized phage protein (TIGR01671 family)
MREIKFRAWDKHRKVMIGSDYPDNWGNNQDEWYADVDAMNLLGIENATKKQHLIVMQYTGLKDKNGKKIYEGDILDDYYVVEYDEAAARFILVDIEEKMYCKDLSEYAGDEEIGITANIYENSNLLHICDTEVNPRVNRRKVKP